MQFSISDGWFVQLGFYYQSIHHRAGCHHFPIITRSNTRVAKCHIPSGFLKQSTSYVESLSSVLINLTLLASFRKGSRRNANISVQISAPFLLCSGPRRLTSGSCIRLWLPVGFGQWESPAGDQQVRGHPPT